MVHSLRSCCSIPMVFIWIRLQDRVSLKNGRSRWKICQLDAAYRGSPVIVSDIATDPLWDVPEHRTSALTHGLRASWSNPVISSKRKVLGTFCMYYRDTRSPNSQDFELWMRLDLIRLVGQDAVTAALLVALSLHSQRERAPA